MFHSVLINRSYGLVAEADQFVLDLLIDFIWGSLCVHLDDEIGLFLHFGDDGLGFLHKDIKALPDGLRVVVGSPAGLASIHQPLFHHFLRAVDVHHMVELKFYPHDFIPFVDVLLVPWESIQQELLAVSVVLNCLSDQGHKNFAGH